MGAPDQATPSHARRAALCDTLDQLARLQGLKTDVLTAAGFDELLDQAHSTNQILDQAHRLQYDLIEAFDMLLTMLDADPEKPLRAAGLMCLLTPLVEKLRSSVSTINAALH